MAYDRTDFDVFWGEWIEANRKAQDSGDWTMLADFYALEATYGWSYSATDHFMANGRAEIRDLALGTEMLGFQGWVYPYQAVLFDDTTGQAFGLWRQLSTFTAPHGGRYEVQGLGGSWFQFSGQRSWAWQRDIFDVGLATETMLEIMRDRNNSPQLDQRMAAIASGRQPGHYPSLDTMRAPLWPVPPILD